MYTGSYKGLFHTLHTRCFCWPSLRFQSSCAYVSLLPGLHTLPGGKRAGTAVTDCSAGLVLVGLEIPPSGSSPCCKSPVPRRDAVLVLAIVVSPFILGLLVLSVPGCHHAEHSTVTASAATQLYRRVVRCALRGLLAFLCFPCPAEQPALLAHLFSVLQPYSRLATGSACLSVPFCLGL